MCWYERHCCFQKLLLRVICEINGVDVLLWMLFVYMNIEELEVLLIDAVLVREQSIVYSVCMGFQSWGKLRKRRIVCSGISKNQCLDHTCMKKGTA